MVPTRRVRSKEKKITSSKVPKTNPQQQRYLKTRFRKTKPVAKQSSVPPNQRIWRRTAVQTKPKVHKKLPKLFRMDRHTGLPVDYERTVQRVMHYVNPQLANRPSAEGVLENLLAKALVEAMRQSDGGMMQTTNMQSLFKGHCKCHRTRLLPSVNDSKREANDSLSQFHSACKRGPCPSPKPKLGPTYTSKFNFNQLKIKSC
ncbi:uncharacterized protein LOC108110617 [Drosophila eugracilis]|uniref:uncharacterized protein LOC108110617 n=1 Tax=Drosophila eugracilis TaxID=29029 RepID=UPI001BDB2107|nr:uncharacterized protein LOC108110617 [Drosophila eugracilis]